MAIILDGTNGITTPDLESAGPVTGTTAPFSGNVTLGSSVLATPSGSAPSYTCRAWVNFNGTGTVAIRASGNVSSITDNGTGNYTVNFTTAMPNTDFCVQLSSEIGGGNGGFNGVTGTITTSAVTFVAYTQAGAVRDISLAYVSIFR